MKNESLSMWKNGAKGILPSLVLLAVLSLCGTAVASEQYGMPSEAEAHRNAYTSGGSSFEEVAWVKSLRRQEDMLFLNGEPFVLNRETRIEEERGGMIRLEDIPTGAQIEVRYRTGSTLEDSGYGPESKILTRIRVLQVPEGKKPLR
jgi:hypothetical protein